MQSPRFLKWLSCFIRKTQTTFGLQRITKQRLLTLRCAQNFPFLPQKGRPLSGDTLHRVHGSEVAFWSLDDKGADNLIASLDKAANRGEMVLETTANGPSGLFYNLWQEVRNRP